MVASMTHRSLAGIARRVLVGAAAASLACGTTACSGPKEGVVFFDVTGAGGHAASADDGTGGEGGSTGSASSSTDGSGVVSSSASSTTSTSSSGATPPNSASVSSSASSSSSSASSGGSVDAAQHCVDTINGYRATLGFAPYTRWTSAEACVAQEATTDSTKDSPHWSFINQMMCSSSAEDECPGGYPDNPLDPGGIDACLALMWAEKDQSICSGCATCDFPYENCDNCVFDSPTGTCGHYLNMKSQVLSTVACGFSTVGWYAQDFSF
jgi:hypothetical protein